MKIVKGRIILFITLITLITFAHNLHALWRQSAQTIARETPALRTTTKVVPRTWKQAPLQSTIRGKTCPFTSTSTKNLITPTISATSKTNIPWYRKIYGSLGFGEGQVKNAKFIAGFKATKNILLLSFYYRNNRIKDEYEMLKERVLLSPNPSAQDIKQLEEYLTEIKFSEVYNKELEELLIVKPYLKLIIQGVAQEKSLQDIINIIAHKKNAQLTQEERYAISEFFEEAQEYRTVRLKENQKRAHIEMQKKQIKRKFYTESAIPYKALLEELDRLESQEKQLKKGHIGSSLRKRRMERNKEWEQEQASIRKQQQEEYEESSEGKTQATIRRYSPPQFP